MWADDIETILWRKYILVIAIWRDLMLRTMRRALDTECTVRCVQEVLGSYFYWIPVILTEVYRSFLKSLQAKSWIVLD
jgi:hypothetical protein